MFEMSQASMELTQFGGHTETRNTAQGVVHGKAEMRTMLPEDARRLPGIIDAPRNAFVFELTPTQTGRRVPRSAVEAPLTRSESPRGKLAH
jgi:hypothetical protein